MKPFVEIGNSCYFFSTNKAPTYEYYKVSYNGRIFSVPAMLDWLHAGFACETLDSNAKLLSIESAEEMRGIEDYMRHYSHINTHPYFWSGGHRGNLGAKVFDQETMKEFYWNYESHPMNYTFFAQQESEEVNKRYPHGFCVYIEFVGFEETELIMRTANCKHQLAYVCELQWLR